MGVSSRVLAPLLLCQWLVSASVMLGLAMGAVPEGDCDLEALGVMSTAEYTGPLSCEPDCVNMTGKVVLITGGSTGIGRATAERLAAVGAIVVGTSRWPDRYPAPANFQLWQLDQTHPGSVNRLIQRINTTYGRIDVLHLNAGRWFLGDLENSDLNAMKLVMETNFWGTLRVLRAALPLMPKTGYARIMYTGSSSNLYAEGAMTPYTSSKRALMGMVEEMHLRSQVVPTNILTSFVFVSGVNSSLLNNTILGCPELSALLNSPLVQAGFSAGMGSASAGEAFYRIATSPQPAMRYTLFNPGQSGSQADNVCRHLTLPMEQWWLPGSSGPNFSLFIQDNMMKNIVCPPRTD